jgi:hypothetical protein
MRIMPDTVSLERHRNRCFAMLPIILALGLGTAAHADESQIEGLWDSPFGRLRIERGDGGLVGRLAGPGKVCGFARGAEVLRGHFADGLFTGEARVCYAARCRHDDWRFTMAALVNGGERLVGAGAPAEGSCLDAVFSNRPFQLTRARADATPIAEVLPPRRDESSVRRSMKPEVQKLYLEGNRLSSAGRYEAARQKFTAAHRLDATNPEILTQIGITWYARSDFPRAAEYYRRALAADPGFTKAHYNLACVLAQSGNQKEALRALRAAVDSGFASVSALDEDSDLKPLRGDPAFEEIRRATARNEARLGQ